MNERKPPSATWLIGSFWQGHVGRKEISEAIQALETESGRQEFIATARQLLEDELNSLVSGDT